MTDQSYLNSQNPGSRRPDNNKPIDSKSLLQGQKEVIIRHGDVEYRLRKTSQDKLILTK